MVEAREFQRVPQYDRTYLPCRRGPKHFKAHWGSVGKSRERIEREFARVGAEAPRGSKFFRDSDRRWVPGDLKTVPLGECAYELGRDHGRLAMKADQTFRDLDGGGFGGQVRALQTAQIMMLRRRAHAIETAASTYGATEDTKVLVYSIDQEDWRIAEPFRTTGTEFLWEFIEAGSSPKKMLRCAKKWGGFGLCEHGIPYGHSLTSFGVLTCIPVGLEVFPAWQHFAQVAEALIKASARLNRGDLARAQDWMIIAHHARVPDPHHPRWKRVPVQKKEIMRILRRWREMGDRIAADREWGAVEDETGGGLFGKIARELTYVVGQKDGKMVCEHCWGDFITRTNEPGVPYYCDKPDCRKAASRSSTARGRERERRRR